ncbi:MAG: hypothetical protein AAGC63_00115 [Propionicimonas sp.]|nr:hypothetical protein [Propionicimonas sp.]
MHHSSRRQLPRRLGQLLIGLFLYGWSMAMLVRSQLGLDPWDVFHEGVTRVVPLSFGQVAIVVGALVLLLWIPLRQKPGIGTVLNILVIGLAADFGLAALPVPRELGWRIALLVGGVVLNGLAGALYVGAGLGPGPRDGLWVAITARTGASIRLVRTGIELTVLAIGWLLGGTVGIGTVVYALAIGPLVQFFMPWVDTRPTRPGEDPAPEPMAGGPDPLLAATAQDGPQLPQDPVAPGR